QLKYFMAALAIAVTFAFFNLEHEASDFALAAAAVSFGFIWIFGPRAAPLVGIAIAIAILAMPIIVDQLVPGFAELNSKNTPHGPWPREFHREYMWRFVLEHMAGGQFWIGHGRDASRSFPGSSEKIMWGIELMPLHPHNGALQAWLELGPLGALAAATAAILVTFRARRLDWMNAGIAVAMLAAYSVPWLVSYGIWQSWWLALGWLLAAIAAAITPAPPAS
ncbi:MAG: O-antigen ligase family protein, partial [Proteobacteria bacterium]|nr:O-antigen ligase family protein [Pseudomonadota bacterium]